jgi:hypothetical protein
LGILMILFRFFVFFENVKSYLSGERRKS